MVWEGGGRGMGGRWVWYGERCGCDMGRKVGVVGREVGVIWGGRWVWYGREVGVIWGR